MAYYNRKAGIIHLLKEQLFMQQAHILKDNSAYADNSSHKTILVMPRHILPSEINELSEGKLGIKINPHETAIQGHLTDLNRPHGTAYNIYKVVPVVFGGFFAITTIWFLCELLNLFWQLGN